LEIQLEALDQINGILEYEKISNFLGIGKNEFITIQKALIHIPKVLKTVQDNSSIDTIPKKFYNIQ
jgi:hypothetical protein